MPVGLFLFWLRLWELNPLFPTYETDEMSGSLKSQYKRGERINPISPYGNATIFSLSQVFENVKHYENKSRKL